MKTYKRDIIVLSEKKISVKLKHTEVNAKKDCFTLTGKYAIGYSVSGYNVLRILSLTKQGEVKYEVLEGNGKPYIFNAQIEPSVPFVVFETFETALKEYYKKDDEAIDKD